MTRFFTTLITSLVLLAIAGCQGRSSESSGKRYPVTAKVVAVDASKGTVTLDHEDIPGLMRAMEMEFKAASPMVLSGVAPGDAVKGTLEVRGGETVVSGLEKQ
jgi:protein SCO1/2